MLALSVLPSPRRPAVRELLGIAALLGILLPVVLYTADTPFPGLAAVPPVLGATILIWIGREGGGSLVGRLLSHRALVGIGLVSYSLYLWHWPILAYLRVLNGAVLLPATWAALAVPASLVMAWLSYRFVERPFRAAPPKGFGRGPIFAFSAATIVVLVVIGGVLRYTEGVSQRLPPEAAMIAKVADDRNPRREECIGRLPDKGLCALGAAREGNVGLDFLVWGDSHSEMLMPGLDASSRLIGQQGRIAAKVGCRPLLAVERTTKDADCAAFNAQVWSWLEQRNDIDLVVLAARWTMAVEGDRYGGESGSDIKLRWIGDGATRPASDENAALVEAALADVVGKIVASGRRVVLLGQVPEVGRHVPIDTARRIKLGMDLPTALPVASFDARAGRSEAILKRIAAQWPQVSYLPMSDLFCDLDGCSVYAGDGMPLYVDDDHVTSRTAKTLLRPRLDQIWNTPVG